MRLQLALLAMVATLVEAATAAMEVAERAMSKISDTDAPRAPTSAYESHPGPATASSSSPLPSADSSVRTGQLALIPSLFCLTMLSSLLPWWMRRFARATLLMRIGACLAAGVMAGSAFVHLLPDAADAWSSYFTLAGAGGLRQSRDMNYPFASMISSCVLLLLVFLERGMTETEAVTASPDPHAQQHGHGRGSSHSHLIPAIPELIQVKELQATRQDDLLYRGRASAPVQQPLQVPDRALHTLIRSSTDEPQDGMSSSPALSASPDEAASLADLSTINEITHQKSHAYVFLLSVAFHSIFDGLSLGAVPSRSEFYSLLIAVVGHKALDGFSLGLSSFSNLRTGALLCFCAAMTPLGIGVGLAITVETTIAGTLIRAIILSMSAGSFLFISLMEMLPAGLEDGKYIPHKAAVALTGWAIIAVAALWV